MRRLPRISLRRCRRRGAIVGQQGVDPIWERLDYASQESGSGGHVGGWVELDVGELGDAIDGQEEEDLALGRAQLAGIDVDVTDLGLSEALAL